MLSFLKHGSGKLNKLSGTFYLLVLVLASPVFVLAGNWSVLGYGTMVQGRYIYDTSYPSYYLNGGLRYQEKSWALTASMPFIITDSPIDADTEEGVANGSHHTDGGIGDLYLYGTWQFPQIADPLWLQLNVQVKFPLHNELSLFSTGKPDYMAGLSGQYAIGLYYLNAEAAYYILGDGAAIQYNNPLRYGFGFGRMVFRYNSTVSIFYRSYTVIVPGTEPPRLLSLGFRHNNTNNTAVGLYLSRGFSESSPDWGLTVGLEWPL